MQACALMLEELGVKRGDRALIYMPVTIIDGDSVVTPSTIEDPSC